MEWYFGGGRLARHGRVEREAAGRYGQEFEKGSLEMRVVACIEEM